ncbi:MAG: response regulator, partial [Acidobacteriota bacterium]
HARVVLVDENETSRQVLLRMLESFRFEVEGVSSGAEALEILRSASPSGHEAGPIRLLLLNWSSADSSAGALLQSIRKDRGLSRVRTVMIIPFGSDDLIGQTGSLGISGLLVKPIKRSHLFDVIMNVLASGERGAKFRYPQSREREADRSGHSDLRGARILVVEDNHVNQQVAMEILGRAGMVVEIADNGSDAVGMLRRSSEFQVVLMDIQMPVMDGYEATRIIRSDPRLRGLPIIAMTAHAMQGDRELCIHAGMNDYVTKPIDRGRLLSVLAKYVKAPPAEPLAALDSFPPEADQLRIDEGFETNMAEAGVHVREALTRLGGNLSLFVKLMEQFVSGFRDFSGRVQDALGRDDWEEAQRQAHSFKGISGNLSVRALFETSQKLESAIKNRLRDEAESCMASMTGQFERIEACWNDAESSIHPAKTNAFDDTGRGDPGKTPGFSEKLPDLLRRLMGSIREHDPIGSEEALTDLKGLFHGMKEDGYLKGVADCLDSYDFEGAEGAVDRLCKALAISL